MDENRIIVVNIILKNKDTVPVVNDLLHTYSQYIIGRMGLPYNKYDLSIICVVLDCPSDIASAISGKLGMVKDATVKTITSKK